MQTAVMHTPTTSLPGLAVALDPAEMAQRFTERLWAEPATARRAPITACTVAHVRLRPLKQRCVIGYRVTLASANDAPPVHLHFAARVYGPGMSQPAFDKAAGQLQAPAPSSAPLFRLPELDMVVWAFPNDCKLSGLRRLGGIDGLHATLRQHLADDPATAAPAKAAATGGIGAPRRDRVELVHYVPEHGCTLRLGESIYAKCHADGASPDAYATLQRLWNSDERRTGALRMPEPLLHLPEYGLICCRAAPGQTLLEHLMRSTIDEDRWQAAARAIAALHRTQRPPATALSLASISERLTRVTAVARALAPASAAAVERLAVHILQQSSVVDFERPVTLHGDLHPQNILLDGSSATLIDFDALTAGPAVIDLGSFQAALIYQALLDGDARHALHIALPRFAHAYRRVADTPVAAQALRWSTAFALLTERTYRCMVRLKPGRSALVDALVALAGNLLAQARADTMERSAHG